MKSLASRLFDFLAPNRLVPLPLETFGFRYAALFALGALLFINDWLTGWWLHWDLAERTVTTYGVVWRLAVESFGQTTFQDYVNFVVNFAVRPMLEAALVLAGIWIYGWKNLRAALGTEPRAVLLWIALAALFLFAATFLLERSNAWSDPARGWFQVRPGTVAWGLKLSALVIAPVFEEFFFRLVLFQLFRTRLPFLGAALLSGLLFGLAHADYGAGKVVLGILAGYAFSWMWEKSGSIAVPIGVHVLLDVVPNI